MITRDFNFKECSGITTIEKCPLCGTVNTGLNINETDGWFICQKCGTEVSNHPEQLFGATIPAHIIKQLFGTVADEYTVKLKRDKPVAS